MPIVQLDTTVGGASANSFITLARAEEILGGHMFTSDWDDALEEKKVRALITASQMLTEIVCWPGQRTYSVQRLAFPRYGLFYRDRWYTQVASTGIPEPIERATALLARYLCTLEDDPSAVPDTEGLNSLTIGPISLDFNGKINSTNNIIPRDVMAALDGWGAERGAVNIAVPLYRV